MKLVLLFSKKKRSVKMPVKHMSICLFLDQVALTSFLPIVTKLMKLSIGLSPPYLSPPISLSTPISLPLSLSFSLSLSLSFLFSPYFTYCCFLCLYVNKLCMFRQVNCAT